MKNIYIIRHCETSYNLEGKIQGRVDVPLSDNGRKQAEALRFYFRNQGIEFAKVFSSPLKRAIETANIVGDRKNVFTDDRLMEFDFGDYDGMKIDSFLMTQQDWDIRTDVPPFPGSSESNADLRKRTQAFASDLLTEEDYPMLVVSHGRTIKSLLGCLNSWQDESLWKGRFTIGTVLCVSLDDSNNISFQKKEAI